MLVRYKFSGIVEDVFDYVGEAAIAGGMAERLGPKSEIVRETAALQPPAEHSILPGPTFRNPLKRLFGRK